MRQALPQLSACSSRRRAPMASRLEPEPACRSPSTPSRNGRRRSVIAASFSFRSAPPIRAARARAMERSKKELGYRPCVGVMLLNRDGLVWIGRRADMPNPEGDGQWWQMPQGGIDEGEDPRDSALRELAEETSIRSATIIAEAPEWYRYDLPEQLIGKSWGGRYRGQTQKWFAARFTGN